MAGEPVIRDGVPIGSLLKLATQRTRAAADPKAKRPTRLRAARTAKAALTRVLVAALDYQGTDQERDWWTLHRAADKVFSSVDRRVDRLSTPPLASKGTSRGPKAAGSNARRAKLPQVDGSLKARKQRQKAAKKRSSAMRPIRVVSGGLGSLGKR